MLAAVAICTALAAAGVAARAPVASAVVFDLGNGSAVSYRPIAGSPKAVPGIPKALDSVFGFLDYGGGPVMPSNTNYTIYWRPSGAAAFPSGYKAGIDGYLSDLAHDSTLSQSSDGAGRQNVDSVATQYGDAGGSFSNYASRFGDGTTSSIDDTHAYPANGCSFAATCITDDQIQTEISRVVAQYNLPSDLSHEYFLITPPGVESCFTDSAICSAGSTAPYYCAYHGNIGTTDPIIYSVDPYVTDIGGCDDGNHPNNNASDGLIQGGLSHEHNESITDPIPNSAWTDLDPVAGGENGDKCRDPGPATGSTAYGDYNQTINGNHYWYQQEWSNFGFACLQRLTTAPALPAASFSSSKLRGTNVDFKVTTSPGDSTPYFYVWQFNDGGEPTVASQSPQISHEFPSAGPYYVGLTVTDASSAGYGASRGLAMTVEAGNNQPPVASFALPSPVTAGAAATFDGSATSDADGTVVAYDWSWGDGTANDAGATANHTFVASGKYTVTLTVTDSSDGTSSVSHDVSVAAPPAHLAVNRAAVARSGGGTALVTRVTVSGRGTVTQQATSMLHGHAVSRCRATRTTTGSSTYTLTCTLDKKARASLRASTMALTLLTTFRPSDGAAVTSRQSVKLARRR